MTLSLFFKPTFYILFQSYSVIYSTIVLNCVVLYNDRSVFTVYLQVNNNKNVLLTTIEKERLVVTVSILNRIIFLVTRIQESQQNQMQSPILTCLFNMITYKNRGIQNKNTEICMTKTKLTKISNVRIHFVSDVQKKLNCCN